jgi:hypothetical protein
MKLHERLRLRPAMWNTERGTRSVELCQQSNPQASDYERAWDKNHLTVARMVLALRYYYSDEITLAKAHAADCLLEIEDFLLGPWRAQFRTPDGQIDPAWWRQRLIWIHAFEGALLWGSVLGRWDFLARVGGFPEKDACLSDGYNARYRDLFVAWGAFLRGVTGGDLEILLSGPSEGRGACRYSARLMQAAATRNAAAFQTGLDKLLRHYREHDFPKEEITKKVSIEATFFVHWAEKEGLSVTVPSQSTDHIVRL